MIARLNIFRVISRAREKTTGRRGFTLIELIMVIVLIGIIAIAAAPKMVDIIGTKAGSFQDKLRADIRYAQNLAMTSGLRSRVDFSVANQYSIQSSTTSTCSAFIPATDPALGSQRGIHCFSQHGDL